MYDSMFFQQLAISLDIKVELCVVDLRKDSSISQGDIVERIRLQLWSSWRAMKPCLYMYIHSKFPVCNFIGSFEYRLFCSLDLVVLRSGDTGYYSILCVWWGNSHQAEPWEMTTNWRCVLTHLAGPARAKLCVSSRGVNRPVKSEPPPWFIYSPETWNHILINRFTGNWCWHN